MICKVCSTSIDSTDGTCPNCGYLPQGREREGGSPKEPGKGKEVRAPRPPTPPREPPRQEPGKVLKREGQVVEAAPRREAAVADSKSASVGVPVFSLDAAGLRQLLAKQPELLEQGLHILTDDKGKQVGVGYPTAVGAIDLLARDNTGALVIVMIAEPGQGEELVAQALQRIGWVRKNLGKEKQRVRGIVLAEKPPENLSYTAAAVADTIAFKSYRVTVTFDALEV